MRANQVAGLVIGAAAFLAALIYIGRQVGRLALLMSAIARLPGVVDQLERTTAANTTAIRLLTARLDGQERGHHMRGRA